MADQTEIHRLAQSEDVEERKKAVDELKNNFAIFEYKKQSWDDLIRLMQDKDKDVRSFKSFIRQGINIQGKPGGR